MPKKYNLRHVEERGKQPKEPRACKGFWSYHTMDQVETLTPEELDKLIDEFFLDYEKRQKKANKNWWYPESPMDRLVDIRYKK